MIPVLLWSEQYGELQVDGLYSVQGLWHLNGDATDSSGNNNNGVVNGATATQSGKFGQAYTFNGSSDYISINSLIGFDGNTGSIIIWGYDTKASKSMDVYLINIYASYNYRFRIQINSSNNLEFFWKAITDWTLTSLNSWNINVWHQMAITWNTSAGELILYLDGEQVDFDDTLNRTWSGTPTTNAIGARYNGGFSYFQGDIDEICLYSRVLSAEEIRAIYALQKGAYGIHE